MMTSLLLTVEVYHVSPKLLGPPLPQEDKVGCLSGQPDDLKRHQGHKSMSLTNFCDGEQKNKKLPNISDY